MSDENLPVEFDDEFVTVVGNYGEAVDNAIVQAAQSQVAAKAKRTRTFLTSELPVRPCTSDCVLRSRCKDYQLGRVVDGDLCKPELRQIKKWQAAFRKGELDQLKDDVGTVAGAMAVQVSRLLEAVNQDGAVIEVDKFSNSGDHYTEKVAHPALREAANLMKTLGIDLGSFLMTPKAVKDTPPQVQVNIGISAEEVHARFAARFGKPEAERSDDS
jgi:hypothetical protein